MSWMSNVQQIVSLILSLWGVIALVMGPYALFKLRNYFPERREAVTPEQMRVGLEQLDFKIREGVNVTIGREALSAERRHAELVTDLSEIRDAVKESQKQAADARERAAEAIHKAELVEERVASLDRLVVSRLDHIEHMIKEGRA